MSITTTFEQSPAFVTGVSNADLHADDAKDAVANRWDQLIITVGKLNIFKTSYSFCSWHSFDLDIPIGATILAVKFVAYSSGSANGGLFNLTSGLMSPQASGTDDWEDAGGFHNWATRADNQMAEWDSGTSTDSSIWHNNAPAFSGTAMSVTSVADDPWSFGEGASLSPQNTVTGLVAHLQSYLDSNQELRGHRVTDSIPVAIHMFRPYSIHPNSYQSYYVENYHQSAQLVVEYSLIVTQVGGHVSTTSLVDAEAQTIKAVSGKATSVKLVSGDGGIV